MSFLDLSNKKIIIFGSASGIGRQTSILLAELGASLVLVDCDEKKNELVKSDLKNANNHITITYDVTDVNNCKMVFDNATKDGIKLNGLVYCVGIAKAIPLRVISEKEYSNTFSINFFGFINSVCMYAKKKYNNGGSIVGVSALNAHHPQKCMTLYAASKAAIEGAVKTLALELVDQNIRINSIVPGAVSTPMIENTDKEILNTIISKQLLGIQTPEQIADYIVFLLSERSSSVTGRSIYADGGMLGQ